MSGTDHPPSTNGLARHRCETPRTRARRALWSSAVAVAVVVGPVTIASATDGPDLAGAAEPSSSIALQKEAQLLRAQADGHPILANLESLAEALAPPTTAPPTTTTTAPPPPAPPPPAPAPAPAPAPVVQPVSSGGGYNDPNNPAAWDRLAQCESGGNWAANTGNGYYGGIQFSMSSWQGVGGTGYPHEASRETQIAMGQRLWNQGGWSHWPACSSELGYR